MINIKSNAITRNVRILYQIKCTGGPRREFTNTMANAAQRIMLAYCVFNAISAAVSL